MTSSSTLLRLWHHFHLINKSSISESLTTRSLLTHDCGCRLIRVEHRLSLWSVFHIMFFHAKRQYIVLILLSELILKLIIIVNLRLGGWLVKLLWWLLLNSFRLVLQWRALSRVSMSEIAHNLEPLLSINVFNRVWSLTVDVIYLLELMFV